MKDTEAREHIKVLIKSNRELGNEVHELRQKQRETTIRYCPVCRHDTLQKDVEKHWRLNDATTATTIHFGSYIVVPDEHSWREYYCLTCGTKLKCTSKEVCEPCKKKSK